MKYVQSYMLLLAMIITMFMPIGAIASEQQSYPSATTSSFYAIKRDNIGGASVNLAFGFTAKKIKIITPATNTDEICVDWAGGTAVCPASNTAGDDRMAAGTAIIFDNLNSASVSVIAASGTLTVYVAAFQ